MSDHTSSACTQSPDPAPSCRLRLNGTNAEQNLLNDLITESIDIYGQTVYYIPRTLVKEDILFSEDTMSSFDGAYEIRAYCNTVDGWEGQGDLLSKFGIRIEDKTTFIVSRKRFTQAVDDNAILIVEGRPNEGDLIWAPFSSNLFEITFVEHEKPFYQLGKGYVWEMKCELFQYSHEDLDTGITAVDEVEDEDSYTLDLTFAAGGTGTFVKGETVYGRSHEAAIAYTHADWTQGFTVWDAGDGYDPSDPPSITFSAPPTGGTQATGTVQVNSAGQVTGVTLNPGSGYTSAPSFTLERSPAAPYGEVVSWNPTTRKLVLNNLTGAFTDNESVKGLTSNATWTVNILDSYNMGEIEGAQNKYFEVKGDLILDFSESNPFGEYGDMGDKF
jgi:hypothetical protein